MSELARNAEQELAIAKDAAIECETGYFVTITHGVVSRSSQVNFR